MKKVELQLTEYFGHHLADGAKAEEFRMVRIDPYVESCDEIVLDFTGIRNINSSFANALVAGLIQEHGPAVLNKVVFQGCNPVVRVLINSAASLGADLA